MIGGGVGINPIGGIDFRRNLVQYATDLVYSKLIKPILLRGLAR
jgi:hypothetical protein